MKYIHSFIHSFTYYAFIKSIQGLAPTGYRICHRIIQKYKYKYKYNCHIKAPVIVSHANTVREYKYGTIITIKSQKTYLQSSNISWKKKYVTYNIKCVRHLLYHQRITNIQTTVNRHHTMHAMSTIWTLKNVL